MVLGWYLRYGMGQGSRRVNFQRTCVHESFKRRVKWYWKGWKRFIGEAELKRWVENTDCKRKRKRYGCQLGSGMERLARLDATWISHCLCVDESLRPNCIGMHCFARLPHLAVQYTRTTSPAKVSSTCTLNYVAGGLPIHSSLCLQ